MQIDDLPVASVIFSIILIALIGPALFVVYRIGQERGRRYRESTDIGEDVFGRPASSLLPSRYAARSFELVDSAGRSLMTAEDMTIIPFSARRVDLSNSGIPILGQLTSDLLKGGLSIPGKTIRLVFKPEIAQGLKEGTYTLMRSKSGDVFADAVNAAHTIVGKGRIVQAG